METSRLDEVYHSISEAHIGESTDALEISKTLETLGAKELSLLVMPKDDQHTQVYVTNNPNLYARFHQPDTKEAQELKMNFVRQTKEWLAGAVPFVAIVPRSAQERIKQAFTRHLAVSNQTVESDGVIIQQRYSKYIIPDTLGIDPYLRHPDIAVHIYDGTTNEFIKDVTISFANEAKTERIHVINQKLEGQVLYLGSPNRNLYTSKLNDMYTSYKAQGIVERLITNEESIGLIATKRGISVLDMHEALLDHGSERAWLEHVAAANFKGLNLAEEQRMVLAKRLEALRADEPARLDELVPSETDILREAISLAQAVHNTALAMRLEAVLTDYETGLVRFQHNIGRGGFLTKLNLREIEEGKQTHWELLKKIVAPENGSPRLIAGKGTYTKGTYLQHVDLSIDDPLELYGFVLEEYMEQKGGSSPISEHLKNMGSSPLVLELASKQLPKFKHQTCGIRYVDTPLDRELRRVIVYTEADITQARSILDSANFEHIDVITISDWKDEVEVLRKAKESLSQ